MCVYTHTCAHTHTFFKVHFQVLFGLHFFLAASGVLAGTIRIELLRLRASHALKDKILTTLHILDASEIPKAVCNFRKLNTSQERHCQRKICQYFGIATKYSDKS